MVIEPVGKILKIYDNPPGELTNSPTFEWHMTNLCVKECKAIFWNSTISSVDRNLNHEMGKNKRLKKNIGSIKITL